MDKPFSAYRGDAPYVFVCYAHEDAEIVYREIAWLHDYGVNIWYDEGISPGLEWTEELAGAIQDCTKVLFFVTPSAVASEHCRRELNFAQEESREVIAIHLQKTEVPAGLRLSLNNRQAILKHELSDAEYRKRVMRVANAAADSVSNVDVLPLARSPRLGLGLASLAVAACIVAAAIWWWNAQDGASSGAEPTAVSAPEEPTSFEVLHNSIAVLPFDNLSPNPDDAYFAAGIHEEVINQLVGIRDLSVISRTSVMQYAGVHKPIEDIARELGVGAVMEGSVRYAGNRVRITAQLIDGKSGVHLWSKAYEDSLEDIFGIQLAIATQIASTLEAEFSPAEQTRISMRTTDNPDAYVLYLRAASGWGNYSPTGPLHEALDAAIAIDPKFAAALALKAMIHSIEATSGGGFFPTFGAADQRRFASLALEYAQRALAIDQQQARAHYALRWNHTINREWEASQRSAARAYESNPNDYMVLNSSGWDALARGEVDRGIEYMERSIALNPNDFALQGNFADFLRYSQRWEYMRKQATLVSTLAPDWVYPDMLLAQANSFIGDVEGVRNAAAATETKLTNPYEFGSIADSYARVGDLEDSRRTIESARAQGIEDTAHLTFPGAAGEDEAAIELLERALDTGFPWTVGRDLHFFPNHPSFDSIRTHPKFDELVQRAALPLVESE